MLIRDTLAKNAALRHHLFDWMNDHPNPGHHLRPIDHTINRRAHALAWIAPKLEAGQIGIVRRGMDCDCTQYQSEYVAPFKGIVHFLLAEDTHEQWLDGPEATSYMRPSDVRDGFHASRDRALEAYEDGHPHLILVAPL